MTNGTPKKTGKKATMTKSEEKYGSLTKSLEKFIVMNPGEREKAYGKNKAKLYERVVKNVEESFYDAVLAYNRLPPEYSRKIDLNMGFNMIQTEIIKQKSPKDKANFAITQAREALSVISNDLAYPDNLTKIFNPIFNTVQNWLVVLDDLEPELMKIKR